jgi:phosphoglycerol transferase
MLYRTLSLLYGTCARHQVASAMLIAALLSTVWGYLATGFVGLGLPLEYDGDTLLVWLLVKTLATHIWVFKNDSLGLPANMELGHFPMSFVGQLAAIKALLLAGLEPIAAINVYYLLTFACTAASAAWVMCRLQVTPLWSATGAVVYSLLPYHFLRAPGHLFLAGYYMVPLGAYVLLQLDARAHIDKAAQHKLAAMCAVMTLFNDIYYTFFLGYLIGAQGLFSLLADRCAQRLKASLRMLAAMFASCVVSMLPALWSLWRPDAQPSPLVRPANDSEIYGLKLIQMLLPVVGHQSSWLSKVTSKYTSSAPLVTENQKASLGVVASVCFVAVCLSGLRAVFARSDVAHKPAWLSLSERLAVFIMLAFIFGTIGGFGAVLSYTTVTFFRCTNRIVIFIAFFAICGGMLMLQQACEKLCGRAWHSYIVATSVLALLYFDVADVVYFPHRQAAAQSFQQDQQFFKTLEASLPNGAHVFNTPFVTFVEGGYGKLDYLQALPYLHTRNLKFSFGAFRATAGDTHNKKTAAILRRGDAAGAIKQLRLEGFDAVLLNRDMPNFGGPHAYDTLVRALGEAKLVDPSQRFVLFGVP